MTFTILRPTPGRSYQSHGVSRALFTALPLTVEVLDPEPRNDYAAACRCREIFRLTDDSVDWLRKRHLLRKEVMESGKAPCVCRCMGKVTIT